MGHVDGIAAFNAARKMRTVAYLLMKLLKKVQMRCNPWAAFGPLRVSTMQKRPSCIWFLSVKSRSSLLHAQGTLRNRPCQDFGEVQVHDSGPE
jgi:hypothetical protein